MKQGLSNVGRHLGARLRERREALGLSPQDLAGRLGTSAREIAMFEEGSKKIPPQRLIQAAETLRVSLDWFFEGSPPDGCTGPASQASRDIARFLAMPESYHLISAFIAIPCQERRRSLVREAQAASGAEALQGR